MIAIVGSSDRPCLGGRSLEIFSSSLIRGGFKMGIRGGAKKNSSSSKQWRKMMCNAPPLMQSLRRCEDTFDAECTVMLERQVECQSPDTRLPVSSDHFPGHNAASPEQGSATTGDMPITTQQSAAADKLLAALNDSDELAQRYCSGSLRELFVRFGSVLAGPVTLSLPIVLQGLSAHILELPKDRLVRCQLGHCNKRARFTGSDLDNTLAGTYWTCLVI